MFDVEKIKPGVRLVVTECGGGLYYTNASQPEPAGYLKYGDVLVVTALRNGDPGDLEIVFDDGKKVIPHLDKGVIKDAFVLFSDYSKIWRQCRTS